MLESITSVPQITDGWILLTAWRHMEYAVRRRRSSSSWSGESLGMCILTNSPKANTQRSMHSSIPLLLSPEHTRVSSNLGFRFVIMRRMRARRYVAFSDCEKSTFIQCHDRAKGKQIVRLFICIYIFRAHAALDLADSRFS